MAERLVVGVGNGAHARRIALAGLEIFEIEACGRGGGHRCFIFELDIEVNQPELLLNRVFAFAAASLLSFAAAAQSYPDRPVRIINTFPAGGSGDAVLRVVFEKVGAALGRRSSPRRAPAPAARSAPSSSPRARRTATRCSSARRAPSAPIRPPCRSSSYDAIRDFTPVVMIASDAVSPARSSVGAGEHGEGMGRLRESESRQAELRLVR